MFKLKEFSKELLDATKKEWLSQAEGLGEIGELLKSDICNKLDGKAKECKEIQNFHAYFLIDNGSKYGCAILDIIQARPESPGSWLKLLDITLEPILNPDVKPIESSDDTKRIIEILASSLIYSIRLIDSKDFSVGKLKIFGRTEAMTSFFNSLLVHGVLEEVLTPIGLTAKKEGRWLVIEKV